MNLELYHLMSRHEAVGNLAHRHEYIFNSSSVTRIMFLTIKSTAQKR